MTQTSNERGSFVQYPCHLIYNCSILTRDDKWVLLSIMGVCWDEEFHKLSYREISALSGVPLSMLSSVAAKNGKPAREGCMDRLKRLGYIRCKLAKAMNRSTGKPKGNAQTYISVDYTKIWRENSTCKVTPTQAEDYQPVSYANRLQEEEAKPVLYANGPVPHTNNPVSYANEPVRNARSNSHTYITVDNSDTLDKDTNSVEAFASDTTLSIIFDIDAVPDFSHVRHLPVVRQWIDQSPTLARGNTLPLTTAGGMDTPPLSGVGDTPSQNDAPEQEPSQPHATSPSQPHELQSCTTTPPENHAPESASQSEYSGVQSEAPHRGRVNTSDTQQDKGSYSRTSATNKQQGQANELDTNTVSHGIGDVDHVQPVLVGMDQEVSVEHTGHDQPLRSGSTHGMADVDHLEQPSVEKPAGKGRGTRKPSAEKPEKSAEEKPKGPPPMPAPDASWSAETLVAIMEAKKQRRYSETTRKQELSEAKLLLKMEYEDAQISRELMEDAIDDMLSWAFWKTVTTKPLLKHLRKDDKILDILDGLKKKPRKRPVSNGAKSAESKPTSIMTHDQAWALVKEVCQQTQRFECVKAEPKPSKNNADAWEIQVTYDDIPLPTIKAPEQWQDVYKEIVKFYEGDRQQAAKAARHLRGAS